MTAHLLPILMVLSFYLLGAQAAVHETNDSVEVKRPAGPNHAIMPYSLYLRRLEERRRLEAERGRPTTQLPEDPQQPVIVYLPAFRSANPQQISDLEAAEVQSLQTNRQKELDSADDSISHVVDGTSQEKAAYSTSSRQPLPYHKSIFRPRTNQLVTNTQQRFRQRPPTSTARHDKNPTFEVVPERPPLPAHQPQQSNSAYRAPFEGLQSGVRSENSRYEPAYQPQPMYSNIIPAPYNTLSSNTSPNNIVDSIFSQSQLRHSPPHSSAVGLIPQPPTPQAVNPLQAFSQTAGGLGDGAQEMLNPLQLLGGGSPLETFSKLARNLLSLPAGNPELFNAMTKALSSGAAAEGTKLTSNAVIQQPTLLSAAEAAEKIAPAIAAKTLISSAKNEDNSNSSLKLLNVLPEEQRVLLTAAIQNGELDGATLAPTLSLLEAKEKGVFRSENKLMEWIQQNRPRAADREVMEGSVVLTADKLPYYGRYCGSFGDQNSTKHFNVVGALWAVDERRLIVSKFHFKPASSNENVTFWAGPANITGNQADMMPSENGFYLRPEPIDLSVFMPPRVEAIPAKINQKSNKVEKDPPNGTAAEIEEMEEEGAQNVSVNEVQRTKRESLMDFHPSVPFRVAATNNETDRTVHLSFTTKSDKSLVNSTYTPPLQSKSSASATSKAETSFGHEFVPTHHAANSKNELVPLDWYAGFQPLLLILPEGRTVQQIHWISVFDHKRKESSAVVWIPNGVAFRVPTAVQFRPLSPNGSYKVSSGAVKVLDTKTIQIDNFNLETSDLPVWFLVGKEIVPHADGQIVPVFDREKREFDCNSLREYHNETVTLRLPGTMDIKDVFWFSVFSIPKSVSLSQLYLPYNDIHLPPDLIGIATPRCIWNLK